MHPRTAEDVDPYRQSVISTVNKNLPHKANAFVPKNFKIGFDFLEKKRYNKNIDIRIPRDLRK